MLRVAPFFPFNVYTEPNVAEAKKFLCLPRVQAIFSDLALSPRYSMPFSGLPSYSTRCPIWVKRLALLLYSDWLMNLSEHATMGKRQIFCFPGRSLSLLLVLVTASSDPDALQDYCIADGGMVSPFSFNGVPCRNPNSAIADHFTSPVLSKPGDTTTNPFGFNVTLTNTRNLPGCNTLGLAMARVDIAGGGVVPTHSHPRASEVVILLKGSLLVGFADTLNRNFFQQLQPGDSFVFPRGLLHFLLNLDPVKPALAISGLNSQNPGAQISSLANFASKPPIPEDVLKKSFRITSQDVDRIRRNLGG